jgi:hypothetical protein
MARITLKSVSARIDALTHRVKTLESTKPPEPPDPPKPPDTGTTLPEGYNSNPDVGFSMLVEAMNAAGLTATGVQRHGDQIVDALKRRWPGLDVYLSRTDSPVWPGFGSLDVTIDSGRGGWSFRPDGSAPWLPPNQR